MVKTKKPVIRSEGGMYTSTLEVTERCETLRFVGQGSSPKLAWDDMWLEYEMYCDPELYK